MPCVYFHINPLRNEVFYVGIGQRDRPWSKGNRNSFWHYTVQKYGLIVDVVHDGVSWGKAKRLERFYIRRIGRRDLGTGSLVNMTDGGDGVVRMSDLTKKRISDAIKRAWTKPEYRAKITPTQKGSRRKPLTEQHRLNIVKGKTGLKTGPMSQEARWRMSVAATIRHILRGA